MECFQRGVFTAPVSIADVNSQYPSVMRDYRHPIDHPAIGDRVTKWTAFVKARGESFGAFPVRGKMSLSFPHGVGDYSCSIHEWKVALELGLFKPHKILETADCYESVSFKDFVTTYYNARLQAGEDGDALLKEFYKFILNSAYGKFAQNPAKYEDYEIHSIDDELMPEPWFPKWENAGWIIWSKPATPESKSY